MLSFWNANTKPLQIVILDDDFLVAMTERREARLFSRTITVPARMMVLTKGLRHTVPTQMKLLQPH
jgi:hypothetical protein